MKEFKSVGSVCLTALIALSFLSCSTGQGGAHFSRTVHFTDL